MVLNRIKPIFFHNAVKISTKGWQQGILSDQKLDCPQYYTWQNDI